MAPPTLAQSMAGADLHQRPSTPSGGADHALQFRQDEELWYEDGSIIIVTQDIAFKVYKGPLIQHSPVNDMLSLPQPSHTISQSCPVVPFHDPPYQLRCFLRALMPQKHLK